MRASLPRGGMRCSWRRVTPSGSLASRERSGRRTEPVTLLVNNAGFGLYGEFVDMPMPRIQEMLVLHLLTVTKLVRLFLPEMRERRKGAIINVASVAGLRPLPYLSLYAATKAFMLSSGSSLALAARKH